MSLLNKNQIKIIKSLHLKKYRQKYELFLLEGEKLVNEVIRDKPEIIQWIIKKEGFDSMKNLPFDAYTLDKKTYHSLSALTSPPPIMAVCKFIPQPQNIILDLNHEFTFYLDEINDPGNFGTILRICDWYGIRQLFCSPHTVDLYNPKTINASKGSILRVNILYTDFENIYTKNTPIYIADMRGNPIQNTQIKNGIIVLGNESIGVSEKIKILSKNIISIPKNPKSKAESLNVAMSASIIAAYCFQNNSSV